MSREIRNRLLTGRLLPRVLLVVLGALAFFPGIGDRALWNPDEPRYAEVAREMVASGEFLVPHLNGAIYTHKPPLLFWSIAGAGALTGRGVDEAAARIPSAVAATLTLPVVYSIGTTLFNPAAGWLSALAFGSSVKILWQGRVGQIDMLLTFLVTVAVWFFVRGYTGNRTGLYPFFFLFAGLATLAKGPVGLLPPLLSILVFLKLAGDSDEIRRLRVGRGLLIWAGVVLAWLVPTTLLAGTDYLYQIVWVQNLERYRAAGEFAATAGHLNPWYYLLSLIPVEFLPWSVFLPGAWLALRRDRDPQLRRGVLFTLCWIVVTLIFFSLSPAKRSVYILTLYPALALFVGAGLDRIAREWPRGRRSVLAGAGIATAVVALIVGVIASGAPLLRAAEAPRPAAAGAAGALLEARSGLVETLAAVAPLGPGFFERATVVAALFLAGSFGFLILASRGRLRAGALVLAVGAAGFASVATVTLLPRYDVLKSPEPLAAQVLTRLGPDDEWATFPVVVPHYLFYVGRPSVVLRDGEELRAWIEGRQSPWVLGRRDKFEEIEGELPLVEVAADSPRRGAYVLLGRPEGRPPR